MSLSGVAGVLTGLLPDRGRLRAASGALPARNALLRACRRHAPRLALDAAGPDGRRRGRAAGGLGDVLPRRGRGEELCRRAVHRRASARWRCWCSSPASCWATACVCAKKCTPPRWILRTEKSRPAAAAADRAGGAGRGGAGDAAVRRGPARRAGLLAAARCCATRWARNSPLRTRPTAAREAGVDADAGGQGRGQRREEAATDETAADGRRLRRMKPPHDATKLPSTDETRDRRNGRHGRDCDRRDCR